MSNTVRSPLKWIGGKSASAERIVAAFPDPNSYDMYVEPFGGAAHILLNKPRAPHHKEVYNDLDGNLVAFWREMIEHAEEMKARLENLPYSLDLYREWYPTLFDGTELSQTERAVRFFYVLRGTGTGWVRKSRVGWNYNDGSVKAYRHALELFQGVKERFRYVAVDNRDAIKTIKRYDSPRTFFYVDAPYIGAEWYYHVCENGFPHDELAAVLQNIQGKAAVSYYEHPSLEGWYPASKWRQVTWKHHKSVEILIPGQNSIATEMLSCNYPAETTTLWDNPSHMATQIAAWSIPVETREEEESA